MKKDELLDIYVDRFFDGLKEGRVPIKHNEDEEDAKYAEMSSGEQDRYAKKRLKELSDYEKSITHHKYYDSLYDSCMFDARDLFADGISPQDTNKIMEAAEELASEYSDKYERETFRMIMSEAYDLLRKELIELRKESNNKKR